MHGILCLEITTTATSSMILTFRTIAQTVYERRTYRHSTCKAIRSKIHSITNLMLVPAPPSRKLESVCVVFRFWCIIARVDLSFRERGNQLRTNTGNNARMTIDSTNFVFLGAPQTHLLSQLSPFLTVLPLAKNPFFFLVDLVSVNCYFYYIVLDALRGSVFSHHPHQNSLFVAN